MSEPNIFATNGDTVMIRATVVDDHWADKRLYKVRVTKARLIGGVEQDVEMWVHDRNLRMEEQP